MLAELSGLETAGIIAAICGVVFSIILSTVALVKKQEVKLDQPVRAELVQALHEQFASKMDFNHHKEKTEEELAALREILRTEIPDMVKEVNAAGEKRIRRVHARLDPLIVGVAQLCAKQGVRMPQPNQLTEEE